MNSNGCPTVTRSDPEARTNVCKKLSDNGFLFVINFRDFVEGTKKIFYDIKATCRGASFSTEDIDKTTYTNEPCGKINVFINNVSPGMTAPPSRLKVLEKTRMVTSIHYFLHRLGTIVDTANAVSFLANPQITYITGETLLVSGDEQMI